MRSILDAIERDQFVVVPRDSSLDQQMQDWFGSKLTVTDAVWRMPCVHEVSPPASEDEVLKAERGLGRSIPEDYKRFLRIANGATLYAVDAEGRWGQKYSYCRELLGCAKLVELNASLFQTFKKTYESDPELSLYDSVNHLAVCDISNGDFLAYRTDPGVDRGVFRLFHEFSYRPDFDEDHDLNFQIAHSLEGWLNLMLANHGWLGDDEDSAHLQKAK